MIRKGTQWEHSRASLGKQQVEVHYLANRLRRYFAPVSTLQAPRSEPSMTGSRSVAISSGITPNNQPDDSAIVQLNNGVAVWNFATEFGQAPAIIATPIGKASDGNDHPPWVDSIGYRSGTALPSGAIIKTSLATDNRYMFVHAVAIPGQVGAQTF